MSRNINRFVASLFVLGLALGLANTSRAQDTKDEVIRPITKQGSAAFMFTIAGLGTFGIGAPAINGGSVAQASGVGVKYFLADEMALRLLLGFSSSTRQSPADTEKTLSSSTFGIQAGVEMHLRPLYSTSPYVGLQIGYSMTSSDDAFGTTTVTDKNSAFSVLAFAGFDWFFTRGIAVGAEMGLGFTSNGGTKTNGASKTSTSAIALATNPNVHAVVYF